jgi:hypothetical protein
MRSFFIFIVLLFYSTLSLAYIPPYWMIMSRVAENHGKGPYQIEQRVVFSHGQEPVAVQEKWLIQDEDELRVEVEGLGPLKDKIRLTYVYSGGRRYFVDADGVRKSEKVPDEFSEPYFHFRRSKVIKPRLVSTKVLPSETLKSQEDRHSEKDPFPAEESYVRLARSGGVVNYFIGTPTPPDAKAKLPGLWIEQDQFNIRKIRFPIGSEVVAEGYRRYSQGAWLPVERRISWNNQSAQVTLRTVQSAAAGKTTKELLSPASLNFGQDPKLALTLPEDEVIREFYLRMR